MARGAFEITAGALALPLALPQALLGALPAAAPAQTAAARGEGVEGALSELPAWDVRAAEHLLSRAGFGAGGAEIERAVERGARATVDELLAGRGESEPFFVDPPERLTRLEKRHLTDEERREVRNTFAREDRELLQRFCDWWVGEMLAGPQPLREHMTLFWHGHFTSSHREVRDAEALIRQNELFRRHATGNFGELLHAVLKDSAMLIYLDNNENTLESPNENLARELFELFTLGEGHYTQMDVQEAARALTGWVVRYPEGAVFVPGRHDPGEKTLFGKREPLDLHGLVDLILEREECARWIAGRILQYFEGHEPAPERLERYAGLLRDADYELEPLLRALFLDPDFYAAEVVGTRISGPIEYLVGAARRLGLEPPPRLMWIAAGQLGQRLFEPPSVKGWEGGRAWIGTSSLLQRGNAVGLILGVVNVDQVLAREVGLDESALMDPSMGGGMERAAEDMGEADDQPGMDDAMATQKRMQEKELGGMRKALDGKRYWPPINLTARCQEGGARTDGEIAAFLCDELLAVEASQASRAALEDFLAEERVELRRSNGQLLRAGPEAEHALRRLAHLVLSLPEGQLH